MRSKRGVRLLRALRRGTTENSRACYSRRAITNNRKYVLIVLIVRLFTIEDSFKNMFHIPKKAVYEIWGL